MKKLEAGPELDKLIAEKVYGSHESTLNPCARISIDCAMALALIEKFPEGWLHHDSEGWRAGFGACPFSEHAGGYDSGPQETAALAISIAALLCACTRDCQVCKGKGKVPHATEAGYTSFCHGCRGSGQISDGSLEAL